MAAEVAELENQGTWSLEELPTGFIALGGRWVYTKKQNNLLNKTKYKARWVAQGFNQVLGIDYIDTFSTTCRPETYRMVIIIAL